MAKRLPNKSYTSVPLSSSQASLQLLEGDQKEPWEQDWLAYETTSRRTTKISRFRDYWLMVGKLERRK